MTQDALIKWNSFLGIIRDNVGQSRFDAFFGCAKFISYLNGVITIGLPSHYLYELYESTFSNIIDRAIVKAFGDNITDVKYVVGIIKGDEKSNVSLTSPHQSHVLNNKTVQALQGPATPFDGVQYADVDPQLNPNYNFSNYCVGNSNKLPHTIAQFIADNPCKTDFNPFFLYGDVGVGKTHLIQAIGSRIKEQNPRAKVLYVTMRQFINQYQKAFLDHTQPQFINWYQHLDVLMIDDLQELSGKDGTINALYPIFNYLHQNGKKLIFTCDRPPMELDGITDRLIDRFKWGITENLPRPDAKLRKAILKHKALKNGLDIPEDVLDLIAMNTQGSVRELEGIVMSIMTRSITLNTPITKELTMEVLRRSVKMQKKPEINFDMILETTAEFCGVDVDVLFSKARMRDVSDARQIVMYLCNKFTGLSYPAIGNKLNRRHTTVLYAVNAVKDRLSCSKEFNTLVSSIEAELLK